MVNILYVLWCERIIFKGGGQKKRILFLLTRVKKREQSHILSFFKF